MRVLVCGGRAFADTALFNDVMREELLRMPSMIIHGCARGADAMASAWAVKTFVPELRCPADWEADGKAAGPMRNARMLEVGKPDLVIAFPGGRGTADMVRRARAAGVRVIEVQP